MKILLATRGYLKLSLEAHQWLDKHGYKDNKIPIEEYYLVLSNPDKFDQIAYESDLKLFQNNIGCEYQTFFTEDFKFVYQDDHLPRTDPLLLQCFQELGNRFTRDYPDQKAKIIDIPDDVRYSLQTSDMGYEYIEEVHRTWYAE